MVDYRSAGTVEYLYDTDSGKWYFLGEYTDKVHNKQSTIFFLFFEI